ncbi:MAG TPA: hypothetical protein VGK67_31155 [Myxococcales bacterium]|jgi:hypothetical protein
MDPNYPEPPPFVLPRNREAVTLEPQRADGGFDPRHGDHDWLRFVDQGAGFVPPTHQWKSNPKQAQDDLGCK